MQLRCTRVIVTGGAGGIGLAIAKRLKAGGARIVLAGRHMESLREAQAEMGTEGVFPLEWDVADAASAPTKFERAEELMGGLDGLVNAAALSPNQVSGRGYEPWDITPEEWEQLISVDLTGTFFMMRGMVDFLRARERKGNILNIASNAACMDIIGAYGASKLSLIRLTRALGKRYGSDGIIINGIAPGATFTPMIAHYAKHVEDPYPRHAIGRFIRPEEIAELAFYLMSDFGEIVCGHTVVADGGDRAATL